MACWQKISTVLNLRSLQTLPYTVKVYNKEKSLNLQEKDILNKAKDEAKQILVSAKEDADEIIRELEMTKDTSKANIKRKKLNEKIKEYSNETEKSVPITQKLDKSKIKVGLEVFIPSLNQSGTIISNIS